METKAKHNAQEIDLTKGQSTSVEGVRDIPTSSEYTSTCSKMKEDQISKRGMPKVSTELMPKGKYCFMLVIRDRSQLSPLQILEVYSNSPTNQLVLKLKQNWRMTTEQLKCLNNE